ncbi:hypothetical protein EDB87DRAFT_1631317 [Lactarius vividus]|nr:hypothetical protein EDB87DRAFT_1631317 [Lactarius vividus]
MLCIDPLAVSCLFSCLSCFVTLMSAIDLAGLVESTAMHDPSKSKGQDEVARLLTEQNMVPLSETMASHEYVITLPVTACSYSPTQSATAIEGRLKFARKRGARQ